MTRIIYIVHSTTSDNEKGIISGQKDPSLSELGQGQAKNLLEELSKAKLEFGEIFCSPLSRAVQTAKTIFSQKPVNYDKRLMEMDYGKLTHSPVTTLTEVRAKYIDRPMPNGESFQDVQRRIQSFLDENIEKDVITIIAHQATQLALEVICNNKDWQQAFSSDWRTQKRWQPFWVYEYKRK